MNASPSTEYPAQSRVVPPLPSADGSEAAPATERNWRLLAACRSADPDLFFPVSATGRSLEQVAEAKAICARCLARRQCLAFALRTKQLHGIWGGMTEEERSREARKRTTPTAPTGARGASGGLRK